MSVVSRSSANESSLAAQSGDGRTFVWVNGERQNPDGPHVSARDRGLTLADGVFETMRASHGVVFRLDRHLARLDRGLAALAIPVRPELREWVLGAIRVSTENDVCVRLTVTRGVAAGGVAPAVDAEPTVVVSVNPLPVFPPAVYDIGLTAIVASGRRNERAMTAGLKTLGYTDAVVALIEAQRRGADEALFLDTQDRCSEATSSNLFIVKGGALVTPPASCGALPGITREAVIEIAGALDFPCAERVFGLDELLAADETFLTSSLRGIAPVVRIAARSIGCGSPGVITRRIADAYAALVARECRA